jgi:hypothetical protein
LELVENPPEGLSFRCPRCGERYTNAVPPPDGICDGCASIDRRRAPGRAEALAAAGVPKRHLHPFVEPGPAGLQAAWPATSEGIACTAWPASSGWSLLLVGVTGAGKSAIAAELLWRAMRDRRGAGAWLRAAEIADQVLSGNAAALRSALEASVLVIDELGIGHDGKPAWSVVENVVCRRWEQEASTLITTNLAKATLLAQSAPMVDRFRDGITCAIEGRSVRGSRDQRQVS